MKNLLIFFLLLFGSHLVSAQKIPDAITNEQTKAHVNISGTRLFMVPQKGYEVKSNFVGLAKGDESAIMVMELIGGNFYTNTASMSPTSFDEKGMKTLDYKELTVNGYPAILLHADNMVDRKMYMLAFGDTTFSTLLMGQYLRDQPELGKEVLKMLLTVTYDTGLQIDPLALAPFTLDTADTRFGFAKYTANMYTYTIGGIDKPEYGDEPLLMVLVFPREGMMTSKGITDGLQESFRQNGFSDMDFPVYEYTEVNGDSAFEAEGTAMLNGSKALLYTLVVRHGDKFVVLQAIARSDVEASRVEFRKLAHSIRFK